MVKNDSDFVYNGNEVNKDEDFRLHASVYLLFSTLMRSQRIYDLVFFYLRNVYMSYAYIKYNCIY